MRGVRKLVAVLVFAALLAGGVSACGGGDDSTATSSSTENQTTAAGDGAATNGEAAVPNQNEGGAGKKGESGSDSGSTGSKVTPAPLHVSGGGSAQFRTPGGDNSIQDYGSEADESELEEAATALHSFLVARAEEDWGTACSYFAKSMVQQLERLGSQSKQLKGKGCGPVLDALTEPIPSALGKELTEVDAASLRNDGERAFLLYHGGRNTDYFMPMAEEDGAWKVGALAATPIS